MNLGKYIKQIRIENNMSQRELAAASGLSNAEISRIEAGKRKEPSPSVLKSIAQALNTPLEDLLSVVGITNLQKPLNFSNSNNLTNPSINKNDGYLFVGNLSENELNDLKQYLEFIISKRKKNQKSKMSRDS